MKRREALLSIATSAAGAVLTSCSAPQGPSDQLSEDQLRALLHQFAGLDLQPGEGPHILASLKNNRFTAPVDPTIQPQSDFDPEGDL